MCVATIAVRMGPAEWWGMGGRSPMCAYGFPRQDEPRGGDGAPELIADGCQD